MGGNTNSFCAPFCAPARERRAQLFVEPHSEPRRLLAPTQPLARFHCLVCKMDSPLASQSSDAGDAACIHVSTGAPRASVHLLPCTIDHQGRARVATFFRKEEGQVEGGMLRVALRIARRCYHSVVGLQGCHKPRSVAGCSRAILWTFLPACKVRSFAALTAHACSTRTLTTFVLIDCDVVVSQESCSERPLRPLAVVATMACMPVTVIGFGPRTPPSTRSHVGACCAAVVLVCHGMLPCQPGS